MLRICADSNTLTRLGLQPPASIDVSKRQQLLRCIASAPDEFFDELGEKFLVLDSNVSGFDAGDSIDLLALDARGNVTVIELSGRVAQHQLIRALSHAALISKFGRDRLLAGVDSRALMDLVVVAPGQLNRRQRVLLIGGIFDNDALTAAEWLSNAHGVDIVCVRMTILFDAVAGTEYLQCDRLLPAAKQHRDVRSVPTQNSLQTRSVDSAEDIGEAPASATDAEVSWWTDLACLNEGVVRG